MSEEEVIRVWQRLLDSKQTRLKYRNAFAGDGAGNVDVDGEPGYIWCRYSADQSKVSKVFSMVRGVPEDFPIKVGRQSPDDEFEQVLWIDWAQYQDIIDQDTVDNFNTSNHGESHNAASGADPAPIDLRNILEMRGRAQATPDLTITVERGQYIFGSTVNRYPGENVDLTASVPGVAGHRFVLVYVDGATNLAGTTDGSIVPLAVAAPIPDLTTGTIPIILVDLQNAQTTITEDDIYDWRFLWELVSASGPTYIGTNAERLALTLADLAELTRFYTTDTDKIWEVWEAAWRLIYPPAALSDSAGNSGTPWVTDANGNLIGDDGAGDSPTLIFRGGTNDDEAWLYLFDSGVANHSDLYIRLPGDTTNSKFVIESDNADVVFSIDGIGQGEILDGEDVFFDVGTVADTIIRTVGAGKDHTTIQAAVDFFKNRIIVGTCGIVIDAGTYDEAVVIEDIVIAGDARLELRGDTRVLAGKTMVDGAEINSAGLTNGGSGTCTLANAAAVITVTGATTNPSFSNDGWGNGDKLLIFDNTGTTTEYTISSTLNNTITLTVAAPNVGNDGTAIALTPNRRIQRTSAGECITVESVKGVFVNGLNLETSTGDNCHGLRAEIGALVTFDNILVRAEDFAFFASGRYSRLIDVTGSSSAWNATAGFYANQTAQVNAGDCVVVDCTRGFRVATFSFNRSSNSIAVNCTEAYHASGNCYMFVTGATARQNTTGYYAERLAYILATSTNANNNGNGTNYNPAVSDVFGNSNGSITWS